MVIENRWLRRKTLRETEDYEIHRERMRKLNRGGRKKSERDAECWSEVDGVHLRERGCLDYVE